MCGMRCSPFFQVLDKEVFPAQLPIISEVIYALPVEEMSGVECVVRDISDKTQQGRQQENVYRPVHASLNKQT